MMLLYESIPEDHPRYEVFIYYVILYFVRFFKINFGYISPICTVRYWLLAVLRSRSRYFLVGAGAGVKM